LWTQVRKVAAMTETTTLDQYRVCVHHGRRDCPTCPPPRDQLPSLRELQREEARRQVANGTLPLTTARHYFPDVTDWPEPDSQTDDELTTHQLELVRSLQLGSASGSAFAYGYLETFVKIVLESGDLGQLRRHYNDLTVAREYVRRQR